MPETEALLPRFRAAHTQVLGVSIDSVFSHANWGKDLGGVSFPLLSDFQPKGAMAQAYGAYLAQAGITDRATVIVDSDGVVQYAESVGPPGRRDIAALAAECERIDGASAGAKAASPQPAELGADPVLYVKSDCGFSRATLLARANLRLDGVAVKNVSEDSGALAALEAATGKQQAPCLVADGKPLLESEAIIGRLVACKAPL